MQNVTFTAAERKTIADFYAATERAAQIDGAARIQYAAAVKEATRREANAWSDADTKPFAKLRMANAFFEGYAPTPERDVTAGELSVWTDEAARAFLAGRKARNQDGDKLRTMEALTIAHAKADAARHARSERTNAALKASVHHVDARRGPGACTGL